MRTVSKKDSNHAEIVKTLRAIGAHVQDVSQLKNCFDILVGYRGRLFIMEVKDGKKPPSARQLTPGNLKSKCRNTTPPKRPPPNSATKQKRRSANFTGGNLNLYAATANGCFMPATK